MGYTVASWATLCILPWTLCILSWHLLFGIRREQTRQHPRSDVETLVPITTGLFMTVELLEGADGRPTKQQIRARIKSKTMEDGPRKPQSVILVFMWLGVGPACTTKSLEDKESTFSFSDQFEHYHHTILVFGWDSLVTYTQKWFQNSVFLTCFWYFYAG